MEAQTVTRKIALIIKRHCKAVEACDDYGQLMIALVKSYRALDAIQDLIRYMPDHSDEISNAVLRAKDCMRSAVERQQEATQAKRDCQLQQLRTELRNESADRALERYS